MKNRDIITLVNKGISLSTALTLEPAQAYKHGKLRRAIAKALESISEAEKDLAKQVTIEDLDAHNKRIFELSKIKDRTEEQEAELADLKSKTEAFNNLEEELMNDTTELEGIKPIPYDQWQALRRENAKKEVRVTGADGKPRTAVVEIFDNTAEDILLGLFWEEPSEDINN